MNTLEAKLLLGWMPRGDALIALCEASYFEPAMTKEAAERLWEQYKLRVDNLPHRPMTAATELAFDSAEQEAADKFMASARKHGAKNVAGVVKVLPDALLIHQFHILTDLSKKYEKALATSSWAKTCLGEGMLSGRVDARQQGTTVVAPLPHAEYRGHFTPDGKLNIIESQPMIGVVRVEESLWLSSGYHRAYAAMCAQNTPILGVVVTHPAVPDVVLSNRAPRLSDYLKTSLAMPAKMWRVRYELHADLKTRTSQVRRLRPSN